MLTAPAQIRTCPIKASGSHQGCLAPGRRSSRPDAHGPAPVTRHPGPVPGTCFAGPRSPRSPPFAPPLRRRSPGFVRWLPRYYGEVRLLGFVHHRLRLLVFPMRTRGVSPLAKPETSRFPRKERPHMPGSSTTPGRTDTRAGVSAVLPSVILTTSAPETILLSRLHGWPVRSPADASPTPSRVPTHGSGPVWIATPSP